MAISTTESNHKATLDALPEAETLVEAMQRAVDRHMASVRQRQELIIKVPKGFIPPQAPNSVSLRAALNSGEPI